MGLLQTKTSRARTRSALSASAAMVITLLAPQTVRAQDAAPAQASLPGDIVVTASRRQVSANNVGITLSAISAAALERNKIDSQQQLMTGVPGLSFASKGTGQSMINLRGVASDPGSAFGSNAINGNATVGIYLDETPIALSGFNPEPRLFDMNRVEVLRGPQGTLFGSGSLSGTIRYISNAPTDKFEARILGDASATAHGSGNYELNGMINIPLTPTLALRVVGYARDISGFIDNVANRDDVRSVNYGDPIKKNVDWEHTFGGRAQLQWKPSDAFSSILRVNYQHTRTGGVPTVDRANSINPNDALLGKYEQSRLVSEGLRAHLGIVNLETNYDFGPATLTTESSYLNSRTVAPYEATDVWRAFFDSSYQANPNIPIGGSGSAVTSDVASKQFTQEVRLASNTDGPLSYIVGVYFNTTHNVIKVHEPVPGFGASIQPFDNLQEALSSLPFFPGLSPDPLDLDDAVHYRFDRRQRQYAAFGELTWKVSDTLSLIGGGRYYHYRYTQKIPYKVGAVVDANMDPGKIKESGFNPKASIEWRPRGNGTLLAYATASKGFRLGGFRDAVPDTCGASAAGWKSDSVWNYEIGGKAKLGRSAQLNVAAYREDWSKIPTAKTFACGFTAIENAGDARIYGIEADLSLAVTSRFSVTGNFAYTDASYRNTSPDGTIVAGTRLAMVPRYSFGATTSYGFPIADGIRGNLSADISYRSAQYDLATASRDRLPGYAIVGMRLGFEKDGWSAALYAQNLFDKYAVVYKETTFLFENRDTILRPRTVGVTLGYKF